MPLTDYLPTLQGLDSNSNLTPEQIKRLQEHAYALLGRPYQGEGGRSYTSIAQPVGDILSAISGRNLLNQTNQDDIAGRQQAGQTNSALLSQIQNKIREQQPQAPQPSQVTSVTTGSLPPAASPIADPESIIKQATTNQAAIDNSNVAPFDPKSMGADAIGDFPLAKWMKGTIGMESGGDINANRPGSQYKSLFQFGKNEEKMYGINDTNRGDREAQLNAGALRGMDVVKQYRDRFGTTPSESEAYLMHQQGPTGGIGLMSSKDTPAWQVLKEAGKVSDKVALERVKANISSSSDLYKAVNGDVSKITAEQFTKYIKDKYGLVSSKMNLGGPKAEDDSQSGAPVPPGQQVAQANGIPPAVAHPAGNVDPETLAKYMANPRISEDQKEAIQKMMIEGATPANRETAQGIQERRPSNPTEISQPGAVQANRSISLHGLSIPTTEYTKPGGERETMFAIPGHGLTNAEGLMKWSNEQQARTAQTVGTSQESTKRYEDTFGGIQELADKSQEQIPRIQKMRELVKDPRFYSGVGDQRVLDTSKFLHALGVSPGNSTPTEVFKKLAAGETLNELKQFNGYGRVLATEFDQLKQSLANTNMSEPAIIDLLDMSEKLHGRAVQIGDEASKYAIGTEHKGLDKGWDVYLRNWKRKNPSLSEEDVKKKSSGGSDDKWEDLGNGIKKKKQ